MSYTADSSNLTTTAATAATNDLVVSHYNSKSKVGIDERKETRIYYLRNFNNWIKSVLIKEHIIKLNREKQSRSPLRVVDLGCGRGGDLRKWMNSDNLGYVLFTDVAELSLVECQQRYDENKRIRFKADFLHMDFTIESFEEKFPVDVKFDMVSCQFVLHYSFETFAKANNFAKNVSACLSPGGYFIGTTTDSFEIVKRLNESNTKTSFGNDVYKVKYLDENGFDAKNVPLFGAKIDFQLDGVVDCPEYLLHFPTLVKIAERHGLKLVFKKRFSDFFNQYSQIDDYKELLSVIKSLEPYDEENQASLKGKNADDYAHVRSSTSSSSSTGDQHSNLHTLSKAEWEAETLYICYCFQKI